LLAVWVCWLAGVASCRAWLAGSLIVCLLFTAAWPRA
jgi:hypothetical protein